MYRDNEDDLEGLVWLLLKPEEMLERIHGKKNP